MTRQQRTNEQEIAQVVLLPFGFPVSEGLDLFVRLFD